MNYDKWLEPPVEVPHFEECPQADDWMAECVCREIERSMKAQVQWDKAKERRSEK